MDQDRFIELAPDYALGLLEGEDLENFERHLAAGCEGCELELGRMDAVGDALAYAAPLVPVPEPLRDRVLAAVDADLAGGAVRPTIPVSAPAAAPARPAAAPSAPKGPGFWGRLVPALAFAGVLAAALSGTYAYKLREQLAFVRADLERVTAENHELARVMDVVGSPRIRVIALGGQPTSPTSQGHVLWSPDAKKAVLYAYGLPKPPAGKDYQLWVIAGSTPRSEGVFPVDDQGAAEHVLPDVPDAATVGAFAVTLEPAGGVPQPTGAMYLLGAVSAKIN